MTLTPCIGQPGFVPCLTCRRLREVAIMRPRVKLSSCAMYAPIARTPTQPPGRPTLDWDRQFNPERTQR